MGLSVVSLRNVRKEKRRITKKEDKKEGDVGEMITEKVDTYIEF